MLQARAQDSITRVIRVAVVFLAAAVFAWGLQSKLALYRAPSPLRNTSVAKLIQGKKQVLSVPEQDRSLGSLRVAVAISILLKSMPSGAKRLQFSRFQRAASPASPPFQLTVFPSFVRPPPQL